MFSFSVFVPSIYKQQNTISKESKQKQQRIIKTNTHPGARFNNARVLFHKAFCLVFEHINRTITPVIYKIAKLIIVPAIVIEAMNDFMTDCAAGTAEIDRPRIFDIEQGSLQQTSRNGCRNKMYMLKHICY